MATSVMDHAHGKPHGNSGLWSWITTVDHKRIGILYGVSAFVFLLIGGHHALLGTLADSFAALPETQSRPRPAHENR